jgi:hypothetical protein
MANGQPYQAGAMTCAAPSGYAFGTRIQFSYAGKTVTCTVTDRGGAINGSHFDLSRGAASALGMLAAGVVKAKFRVSSTASSSAARATGSSGGGATGGMSIASGPIAVARDMGGLPGLGSGGGTAGGAGAGIHVHVHVDGQRQRAQRVLVAHKGAHT